MPEQFTSWVGNPQQNAAPLSAMMAMSGHTPIFAADQGPRYTGPFNSDGQHGAMLQMMMPIVMQMMMGNKHMPAQFFPAQGMADQLEANRYMQASQQAMTMASRRDTRTMESMIGGITQAFTGKPLTALQQANSHRVAGGISEYMPLLIQAFGPDLIDQLHGQRGSATVFAQQMHQALRTGIDPVSRSVGYSGESAGRITQDMFENMFGDKADIEMMKGMSAGQAGVLMNELQARGMLGRASGTLPIDEQRSRLPKTLTDDTVNRLAEQLPSIKAILDAKQTPNEDVLAEARETIRSTHRKLIDPAVRLNKDELADSKNMPGAQEIIRSADAGRYSDRLKNLSGAVKAMRDIFGDMGKPNAPMREIINGLDALTQGGMATMSPGQLEAIVRKTHTLARQTGIGVEGVMALTTQGAAMADQLGLDRSFAITAAHQAATFGAAAGDQLDFDIPAWGVVSKDKLTLGDHRLRMHAAASPLANQLNAVMRMRDAGMARPEKDTELAAFITALEQNKTEYEFGGQKHDIVMPHSQMVRMLSRDAGVNETEAYAILSDTKGNQEFGQKYNTTDTVRQVQIDDTINKMLTPTLSSRLRGMATEAGVDEVMRAEGLISNEEEFRAMMSRAGQKVSKDFIGLDSVTERTEPLARKAMAQSLREWMSDEVRRKMPNAAPAEVDAITANLVDQFGGEHGLDKAGTTILASLNQLAGDHPVFESRHGMHDYLSKDVMEQAGTRDRQAQIAALHQAALAGLGTSGPAQRISDALQNATTDTTFQDLLSQALGGVDNDAINAADPDGSLARVFGLIQENNKLDPSDPAEFDKIRRNYDIIQGVVNGGDAAMEQLKLLDDSRTQIKADAVQTATPAQRSQALEQLSQREQRSRRLRDAKLTNEQTRLTAAATRIGGLTAGTVAPDAVRQEEQMVTSAANSLTAGLGTEEVALGGNRFLTGRGIVVKNADGTTASITGFDNMDAAKEAVTIMQRRHDETVLKNQQEDATNDSTAVEQKLKQAAQLGLLRGDITVGNADLYDHLKQAASKDGGTSRDTLIQAIKEGDRRVTQERAVKGQQELLMMGLKKGAFGDKTQIEELSDEEKKTALEKINALELSKTEQAELDRIRNDIAPLNDVSMTGMGAADIANDTLQRIQQSSTTQQLQAPVDDKEKTMHVTVTGSVTQRDDGLVDLHLGGKGIMDAVNNALG